MHVFLLRSFLFAMYIILFMYVPVHFFSNYDNLDKSYSKNHNIISLQTISQYDSLDILFLGNSYSYSSINTDIFDSLQIRVFNFGIATAGVEFYDLMINDYINSITTVPKLTLILVSPTTFSSKSDNFISYPIHRYLVNEKNNLEIAIKYRRFKELNNMYKKSLVKSFELINKQGSNINTSDRRQNNKGFQPSNKIVNDSIISNDESLYITLKTEIFVDHRLKKLFNLQKDLENRGSKVVYFEVPTFKLRGYFNEDFLLKYDNILSSLEEKNRLLKVNENLFNSNNYRNIDHMNTSGANIATTEIIRQLFLLNKL